MKEDYEIFEDENFHPYLKELAYTKSILKKYGLFVLFALLGSILSMTLFAFAHKYSVDMRYTRDLYTSFELPLLFLTFVFIFFGIILLFNFNSLRDRGMILYEEITDEIDWSRKRKEFIHKPPMKLRIIIKEFLKATDLPFTTGKNGQGFYIFLFLIISIVTILIKILL